MAGLVVIGGVAAGMSAASKARRMDKNLEIMVFTDEDYVSYAGCGLPYYIAGEVKEEEQLLARTREEFEKEGIKTYISHRVTAINPQDKTITVLANGKDTNTVNYDKLVIATGARAFVPDIPGRDLPGVFGVKTVPEARNIREILRRGGVREAVIVGGGYIGIEMVEALSKYAVKVTVVELLDQILGNMDADLALKVEEYLAEQGVVVRKSEKVLAIEGGEKVRQVVTDKGVIPADLVILAIGVRPNSEIAEACGIELGKKKAVKVNRNMETNLPDIYAAGDCATARHIVTGADVYIPLGTTANKQGKLAGENAAGGHAEFTGIVGTAIMKVMELEVSRTGLSRREADTLGMRTVEFKVDARTMASYYPSAGPMTVKILVEEGSNRLLGAQIVGRQGAGKRIDVLACSVQLGLTPFQLAELDLSYAPPFSPVWDPVLVAANVAVGKLEKKKFSGH